MGTATLIGRDRELDELASRTQHSRLVTVIGPGGVGKTALARAVADRLGDDFPLGVRHVDLTRVSDEDGVRGAFATQLGFDSFDAVLTSPSDRPMLLVVDNCEHLIDTTADAVVQVLGACRQPTVIATSRSPLELPGESVLSLTPLDVPVAGAAPLESASVRLFLQRCREAGAVVDDDDLDTIVELCRRLDGLPLAIELAAARARTMSIAELAARLHDSIDVLHRPRFRGDPRHRGVGELVRWSYDLLDPSARRLFEHLSVFAGPFPLTSAAAVAADATPDPARDLQRDLDELVQASLVVVDTTGAQTRYRMLDTVRRFARERLDEHDGSSSASDRYVDHVIERTLAIVRGATTSWRPGLLGELVAAYDDVVEALRWCHRKDATPDRAHLLGSLLWTVVHQAHADDIAVLARATLDRWPGVSSPFVDQLRATLASAEYVTGHPDRAIALAEEALTGATMTGLAPVTLRRVLGQARRAIGDVDGALAAFRDGAAVAHGQGMAAMGMELEVAAAQVIADAGDPDTGAAMMADVELRARAAGSVVTANWAASARGWVLLRSDPGGAERVIEGALVEARSIDYPIAVLVNLRSLAYLALLPGRHTAGEPGDAVSRVAALLDELIARGALSNARLVLDVAAALAHRCGHPSRDVLAATARSSPITTLVSAQYELIPLPPGAAQPVPRHDAIAAVRHLLTDLAAGRAQTAPTASAGDDPPAGAERPSVRSRGDVTEWDFAGRTVGVRSSKGVRDIVRLIEAAGAEVHCVELAGAAVEQPSTGEVIDARARSSYEDRIRELQVEVDEADEHHDYARSYRAQVELDAIIEQLTAALGRGGRSRQGADTGERARSAVTHRIRGAIRQLGKVHPQLAAHLDRSIVTGHYCAYRPELPLAWSIDSTID
jgi:predicted ATPase